MLAAASGLPPAPWLLWFCAAALLHTLIDIPTHADDGPLLLFSFDWRLRIRSPVSYWDPNYHGRTFAAFEAALDLLLLGYLLVAWLGPRMGFSLGLRLPFG